MVRLSPEAWKIRKEERKEAVKIDLEMARIYIDENKSVREISKMFNLSYSTTHRRLTECLKLQGKTLRSQGGGHNKGKTFGPRQDYDQKL